MLSMLLRRLSLGFITVALVSIIIFTGVEFLPGDACTAFLEREAQGKLLENCRRDLDLNRPAIDRYLDWASSAMVGDLGVSVNGQQSIAELVGNRMNNSLLLAFCALLVGVPLAIFFGCYNRFMARQAHRLSLFYGRYICHDHSRICVFYCSNTRF